MEVEVEMRRTDGTTLLLSYGTFKIDGPNTNYTLHVSEKQHEDADDLLEYHDGMKFSTIDRDNDRYNDNCARQGGWWFDGCYNIHLTNTVNPRVSGSTPYDYAELRVRPKTCNALQTAEQSQLQQ